MYYYIIITSLLRIITVIMTVHYYVLLLLKLLLLRHRPLCHGSDSTAACVLIRRPCHGPCGVASLDLHRRVVTIPHSRLTPALGPSWLPLTRFKAPNCCVFYLSQCRAMRSISPTKLLLSRKNTRSALAVTLKT